MFDVIIIGKGPAGITASIYIQRAGLNSLVIGKDLGALAKTDKIENYYGFKEPISGKELLETGIKQAENLGSKIISEEVISIGYEENFIVKTTKRIYNSTSLILATGSNRNSSNIKGIKEFEGRGISYCAVCDAFFYRGKDVAVLGSGDYAISEAMELAPIAKSVTILTNGKKAPEYRSENIKINENPVKEFIGNEKIDKIEFENNDKINIDGVFIAEGVASSTDLAKKIGAETKNNNIIVNENQETNIKGMYACGDCTQGIKQITKAVYEGTKAGLEAVKFVRSQTK